MLSRVAERIYWGGRYLERAENTARMVSIFSGVLLDLPDEAGLQWRHLVAMADSEALFQESYPAANEDSVLSFLIGDRSNPGSITSSLSMARENFRTTRDVLPREAWESINTLHLFSREKMRTRLARQKLDTALTQCLRSCQQVTGALHDTMSHGDAYRFLNIGRLLERADMNSRTLDAVASAFPAREEDPTVFENSLWMAVLQSQSAYQMYRQSMRRRVARHHVLRFLTRDVEFPRSMAFCLAELGTSLSRLPRYDDARNAVAAVRERIVTSQLETMSGAPLHEWIDGLQIEFNGIHDCIRRTWFLPDEAQ